MDRKRFNEISKLIFERLETHDKENTSCILPIINKHLNREKCIPILEEVSKEFDVCSIELEDVLTELIDTNQLFIVPNKSGRWGTIIYSKR